MVAFVDRVESAVEGVATTQRHQDAICVEMQRLHMDPNGPANTSSLRRAGMHAANALGAIGDAVGADISADIEAAKRALDTQTRWPEPMYATPPMPQQETPPG